MSEMHPDEVVEEISIETSEADVVDQHRLVTVSGEDYRWPKRIPFEADPADVADQERTVDLGEDEDYR